MQVDELLARHPWPRDFANARRLEWQFGIDVPASAERVWPLLADVSTMNRAMKLPRMTFTDVDGVRWGKTRYTGVPHEWIEVPWDWVAGSWFHFARIYKRGAMRALFTICELERISDEQTRVQMYFGAVPRSRIFDLGLKWNFAAMRRAYARLLPQAASDLARDEVPTCLRVAPAALRSDVIEKIDHLSQKLVEQGVDPEPVRSLVDWIRTADDTALERIRVLERARAWNLDEDELLRACLHATRAGLLELTWDIVCPHCRGVRDSTSSLGNLPTAGACDACGITFGTDAPESIEIAFHPHSSIRPIEVGTYCSAEPAFKPHIHAQLALRPGESSSIVAPSKPGRYRARLRGQMQGAWLDVVAEGGAAKIDWRAPGLPADAATLAPGATIALTNASDTEQTFVVETAAWLELALRPGRLLSMQDFRDLFAEEYLGTDVKLAVGEQTILFTDLVGSTAMYARRGDPSAFVEVKTHFDKVFPIVGSHGGAVVKTIGDAVMAAFNDPLDAIKAAKAIHEAFPPKGDPLSLRLRISLNTGPCIAVRLNSAIDYFGHTVNVAAKLQAAAESWQVAMSPATLAGRGVSAWLAEQGVQLVDVDVKMKGVDVSVTAKQWTLATE